MYLPMVVRGHYRSLRGLRRYGRRTNVSSRQNCALYVIMRVLWMVLKLFTKPTKHKAEA